MQALIEVIEIKTGKVKKSVPMGSVQATLQLENIPDQCNEDEANFEHRMIFIHEHGVRVPGHSKFTKIYFDDTAHSIF